MNPKLRRYAPFALYVAILAAVVSAALYFVRREFDIYLQISLSLLVIALAVFIYLDPDRIRTVFSGRQARFGSNVLVMTLAVTGILVVINYLGYSNSKHWDLTEDKENTLAPETIQVLETLEQPVQAEGFYVADSISAQDQAEGLLSAYRRNSKGKFTYDFVDPNQDPLKAQAANVVQDRTIVLSMGDRQEQVTTASEQELTSALIRLIAGEVRTVYFLSGHGERPIDTAGDRSYTRARSVLDARYEVQQLDLLATNEIPDDANLIIIAGPAQPITDGEMELIKDYVAKGGSLLILLEPSVLTDFTADEDLLVQYVKEEWGIVVGDDVVLDRSSSSIGTAYGVGYGAHAITNKLVGTFTGFPTARSVQQGDPITGITKTELVLTAGNGVTWAETNLEGLLANETPEANADEDILGPVSLAVAAENFSTNARLVVIGDADFASDANIPFLGNADFLVNSVDWAVGEENIINLTPKDQTQRVVIAPQASTIRWLLLFTVFVLPGSVLVAGGVVWYTRRRRS